MTQSELQQQIELQRSDDHHFIQWHSDPDGEQRIELLDYFLRHIIDTISVDVFQLWDMEQMWQELLLQSDDKFSREWRKKVEVFDWHFCAADGSAKVRSCCFRPEGLLATYEEVMEKC
ncbi:MAG: hypothetical protein U9R29_07250 [Thermodesulfobacteriota bacterium]|nr:hypothetical protein [Thermodesulfobacteriota bacterium]